MDITPCDTKALLDTEFEAVVFAAKKSHEYKKDFTHYQCGTHWHITHSKEEERIGYGKGYYRCRKCEAIIRKGRKHRCESQNT